MGSSPHPSLDDGDDAHAHHSHTPASQTPAPAASDLVPMPGEAVYRAWQRLRPWRGLPYLAQAATLALLWAGTASSRASGPPATRWREHVGIPAALAAGLLIWAGVSYLRDRRAITAVERDGVADSGQLGGLGRQPRYLVPRFAAQHVRRSRLIFTNAAVLAIVPTATSIDRYGPVIGGISGAFVAVVLSMGGLTTALTQMANRAALTVRLDAAARRVTLSYVPADALLYPGADVVLARLDVDPDTRELAERLLGSEMSPQAPLTDLIDVARGILSPASNT